MSPAKFKLHISFLINVNPFINLIFNHKHNMHFYTDISFMIIRDKLLHVSYKAATGKQISMFAPHSKPICLTCAPVLPSPPDPYVKNKVIYKKQLNVITIQEQRHLTWSDLNNIIFRSVYTPLTYSNTSTLIKYLFLRYSH